MKDVFVLADNILSASFQIYVGECEQVGPWNDVRQGLGGLFNSVPHQLREHGFSDFWASTRQVAITGTITSPVSKVMSYVPDFLNGLTTVPLLTISHTAFRVLMSDFSS